MTSHDQLFKELFQTFFADLVRLVAPEAAERLDLENPEFLDKEAFTDQPEGQRAELDLVAQVSALEGPEELVLVHMEAEGEHRADMAGRMLRYYRLLRLRHPDRLVLPIVVYLRGGPAGVEVCEVIENPAGVMQVSSFRFLAFGLSAAPAETFVERSEALAWALAALMRWPTSDKVEHKLACLRRIALADLRESDRFQLLNIVETYIELDDEDAERYAAAVENEPEEVAKMELTWADKLVAKGRTEGLDEGRNAGRADGIRQTLRRFLEKRFGPLSTTARERLDAIEDPEALDRLGDRIFDARSLDELGLA